MSIDLLFIVILFVGGIINAMCYSASRNTCNLVVAIVNRSQAMCLVMKISGAA